MESEFLDMKRVLSQGLPKEEKGVFELADGGTILLDEISEIAPSLQAKTFRVLQEKEFERVGGNKTIEVKVRVLATTNRNLLEEVQKGQFSRRPLLSTECFPIPVPALEKEVATFCFWPILFLLVMLEGMQLRESFSKSCEQAIISHNWPGNVRELENAVERAVILAENGKKIEADLLGFQITS